jgi:Kef-type K+ transport system membrane component KefB/nucleotide-binding universal stress UspA family protein
VHRHAQRPNYFRAGMEDILRPISGHAILILLLQLAGLLLLARLLAEAMRRIGQPAVIGELLAGVLLGPTILGHFAPGLFTLAFPQETAQFHLLEVISWLGMILLLLLTGLETDIRAMRNLGRAAFMASVFGMVVPFGSGLALGWMLPDAYLTDPANRPIFAAFLATAMAISAMPVIAKILIDLDLIRRNVGMVILSAAVVDDTTGWLVLSIIAGIAAGGAFAPAQFAMTLLWLVLFLVAIRWLAYPALARAVQYVNGRVDLAGADITLILVFTFLTAAATEAIGIHAVFGAFVAGLLIRQLPRVRSSSLEALEVFVLSALSPIFFAFVGLKVDLWALTGWQLPLVVIGVAIFGKLAGCYLGGRLGRLSHWESLAIGFGMNARGAMELIVALIGLSLGLLTQEMYSTIVMVAVVTSFMAPLLLRWAIPHIPLREDERRRLEDTSRQALISTGPLRILVPTAGGENALAAIRVAAPLARRDQGQLTALFVDTRGAANSGRSRRLGRRSSLVGTNLETHFARAREAVGGENGRFAVREIQALDVADAVLGESRRDYDLLFVGAAPERPLDDPLLQRIARQSAIPVVIVKHRPDMEPRPFARLLVPVDGSLFSRHAAELALAYAGAANAECRILHVVNQSRLTAGSIPVPDRRDAHALTRRRAQEVETQIHEQLAPLAESHGATISIRILASASPGEIIIGETQSGSYDLLILGAENKLLGQPLFFGQGTAEIVEQAGCTTAVIVPAVD